MHTIRPKSTSDHVLLPLFIVAVKLALPNDAGAFGQIVYPGDSYSPLAPQDDAHWTRGCQPREPANKSKVVSVLDYTSNS